MSNKFLRDADKFFVDAELPKKYADLIIVGEWETFKSKRNTKKFESLSVVNRQRASSPAYPYRKGRMGYARLQQSIVSIYKLQSIYNICTLIFDHVICLNA